MTGRSRYLVATATLFLGALLTTCSNELAPTGAIAVQLAKGAGWPDTLAVAELASFTVAVTGPGQQPVTGTSTTRPRRRPGDEGPSRPRP